jgi:hypothetical protein
MNHDGSCMLAKNYLAPNAHLHNESLVYHCDLRMSNYTPQKCYPHSHMLPTADKNTLTLF